MARSIARIEQDLAELDQGVANLAAVLQDAYAHYLEILGSAVQKQAVMAVYHICTQGYPDQFLSLSLAQRHKFQEDLHQLTKQARSQLEQVLIEMPPPKSVGDRDHATKEPEEDYHQPPSLIMLAHPMPHSSSQIPSQSNDENQPSTSDLAAQMHQMYMHLIEQESSLAGAGSSSLSLSALLLRWQAALEKKIAETLVVMSRRVNHLLREGHILPKGFPEKILDAAVLSEEGDSVAGPPNLLNLTIEAVELPLERTEKSEETEETEKKPVPLRLPSIRIMAVRIRLSEIEFADPAVMAWRNNLRNTLGQLKQLEQRYQQKLRELAVAQAEAAWRSSWTFED